MGGVGRPLPVAGRSDLPDRQPRGHGRAPHQDAAAQQQQFDDYVRATAGSGAGAAGEIERAKKLLDAGTITQAEFDAIKAKALAAG